MRCRVFFYLCLCPSWSPAPVTVIWCIAIVKCWSSKIVPTCRADSTLPWLLSIFDTKSTPALVILQIGHVSPTRVEYVYVPRYHHSFDDHAREAFPPRETFYRVLEQTRAGRWHCQPVNCGRSAEDGENCIYGLLSDSEPTLCQAWSCVVW